MYPYVFLLPIAGVILEITREDGRINTAFFILYFISILGFVTMKYGNKKMVERLYKKYSGSVEKRWGNFLN